MTTLDTRNGIGKINDPLAQALGGNQTMNKLDQFLTTPGGGFLMNLLAQSGYSTMPQSPFGAIGKAALMTQQQGQARSALDAKTQLMEAQAKALGVGKTPESFRAPTKEEVAAYRLDPNKPYRVNSVTGEIHQIGGAPGATVNVSNAPAPEKGYRNVYDDAGNLVRQEPIPGSGAAGQRETRSSVQSIQAQAVIEDIQRLNDMANDVPFGRAAALQAELHPSLQSDAYRNANALIKSVQGNVGVDQLINIKQSGAGLGQVPQAQLDLLSRLLGELSMTQSKEQFMTTWNRTGKVYREVWRKANDELTELGVLPPEIFDMDLFNEEGGSNTSDEGWSIKRAE